MKKPRTPPDAQSAGLDAGSSQDSSRAKVLAVAIDLFSRNGFDGVSVREIVNAAGVTPPTIYLYFKDKRGLYEAAAHEIFGRTQMLLEAAAREPATPQQRLLNVLHENVRCLIEDPHLDNFILHELLEEAAGRRNPLTTEQRKSYFALLNTLIADASRQAPNLRTLMTLPALLNALTRYERLAFASDVSQSEQRSFETIANQVVQIALPRVWEMLDKDNAS